MTAYERFLKHPWIRRMTVLASAIFVLWLARSLMSTILLTFIFTFLIIRLVRFVQRFVHVRPALVVTPIFLIIVAGLYYVITRYVPEIATQSVRLFTQVQHFYESAAFDHNALVRWGVKEINQLNLNEQLKVGVSKLVEYVGSVGTMLFTVFSALILSFFYTIELDQMNAFGRDFLNSEYGWYFRDLKFFADKFINTFGTVMEAQIFIALVNTAITVVTLMVIKMPNIPSLGVMVFLLSLIPVAGAIISVVPLSLIGYTVGGWRDVATIIMMIIIIHVLEAYVLNPKFMSSRTELPIFFTFVVLMVAEHIWGTWGLIVGIPVFTFLLDIFGIKKISPDPDEKKTPQQPEAKHDQE